jgi:ABC-type nitrate/sulfonate/bicarbonate transport system substrate-binding protein
MKKFLIVLVVMVIAAVIVVVFVKNQNSSNIEVKHKASLRFSWIPSASFAGDVVGLTKFAQKHGLELNAEFGGPGINTAQMVLSDQNTFGYLAADEVLAANDKGADFVIIGVLTNSSPAGFVSLANKNIKTPQDLEGKKVGILPFGNATLIYESMLKKNAVNRSKIQEITVSEDLKPFLSGVYDVHPVFVYDETVNLDKENIQYNVILPKDFGVKIKGAVYFTKRSTLEENPELVKAFIQTMADGWNYTIENQTEAIAVLKAFAPEIDEARERQVLKKAVPYFTEFNNQLLNSSMDGWDEMTKELQDAGVIKDLPDLTKVLQLQFINQYYQ